MTFKKKLIAPALLLSSIFATAASAEEKLPLPDAPSAVAQNAVITPQWKVTATPAIKAPSYTYALPQQNQDSNRLFDGKLGQLQGYFEKHSNDAKPPFDFVMEYDVSPRITFQAGSLADIRKHGGKYEADRMAMRVMTSRPDWETRYLRETMAGTPYGPRRGGGQGVAIGLKIQLGPK